MRAGPISQPILLREIWFDTAVVHYCIAAYRDEQEFDLEQQQYVNCDCIQ